MTMPTRKLVAIVLGLLVVGLSGVVLFIIPVLEYTTSTCSLNFGISLDNNGLLASNKCVKADISISSLGIG